MSRAGNAVPGSGSELGRARLRAQRAVAELTAARQAWGCWADSVRERAEQRLAVSDLEDPRVQADPEYGRALDAGRVFGEALRAAEAVLGAGLPAAPGTRK